jgi:hypothetical protein
MPNVTGVVRRGMYLVAPYKSSFPWSSAEPFEGVEGENVYSAAQLRCRARRHVTRAHRPIVIIDLILSPFVLAAGYTKQQPTMRGSLSSWIAVIAPLL